jgi:hypothetical protein
MVVHAMTTTHQLPFVVVQKLIVAPVITIARETYVTRLLQKIYNDKGNNDIKKYRHTEV